jgi:S-DNA-T family DNA segregation ATPase FtsK/SpoIIIE
VITGVSDAQFELMRWYFVEVNDDTGYDAAADVIARCMANVAPGTPVAGSSPQRAIEVRDLLDDLAEVAGPDRIRLADLPARLRKLAPSYGLYRGLTGVQLRDLLDELDVRTTNPKNVPTLDPADLRRALAEQG